MKFFGTVKSAKMKIQRNKVERALSGKANATYIFDMVNNTDYNNTSSVDLTIGEKLQSSAPTIVFVDKFDDADSNT